MSGQATGAVPRWRTFDASARLWLAGVHEAVQFQRCLRFFLDSPGILEKAGLCFVLNIFIFLGSIGLLHFVLEPALQYLIGAGSVANFLQYLDGHVALATFLGRAPAVLFNALWLVPMYVISFIANCIWYSEMAKMAVEVQQERQRQRLVLAGKSPSKAALLPARAGSSATEFLAQEIYKLLLFTVFFLQVVAVGFIPYVGPGLYFLLSSLLYAFYCFDYGWGATNVPLEDRIAVIESNWAFFMGFGGPCVLCSMVLPFYVGVGLVNFLYPLFVLIASDTNIHAATETGRKMAPARRLPIMGMARRQADGFVRRFGPTKTRAGGSLAQSSASRQESAATMRSIPVADDHHCR